MKRYLGIVLAAMFVFGFAASAFAIHAEIPAETQAVVAKGTTQITLGGELRFRGFYRKNTDVGANEKATSGYGPAGKDDQNSAAGYDGRVRLRIQADVSKNTTGVIHIEAGKDTKSDTYAWGQDLTSGEGKGVYPQGNAKQGSLNLVEAWIQHKFNIGVPAGIKVGHMPLALGNKLFFDHSKFGDDAIMFFMDPTKELHIGLLAAKFNETTVTKADDADAYVALFTYNLSKTTSISGDVTMVDDKRAYITTASGAASLSPNDKGTRLYNFGLRGNTMIGDINLRGNIELQRGTSKTETTDLSEEAGNQYSIKHKGYAYLVGADFKLQPVTLTLEYAYGSGDKDINDDTANTTDTKNSTFVTALSGVQNYTFVYDLNANTSMCKTGTGIANTQYIKLGAKADLSKDMTAIVNIYSLKASKAVAINGARNADGTYKKSKNIGTEVDARITYKLDKNLVYFVEGGYLFTGSAYDYKDPVANTNGINKGASNAYAVRHGLVLNF